MTTREYNFSSGPASCPQCGYEGSCHPDRDCIRNLRNLLLECHRELSAIEAITVSPMPIDETLRFLNKIGDVLGLPGRSQATHYEEL